MYFVYFMTLHFVLVFFILTPKVIFPKCNHFNVNLFSVLELLKRRPLIKINLLNLFLISSLPWLSVLTRRCLINGTKKIYIFVFIFQLFWSVCSHCENMFDDMMYRLLTLISSVFLLVFRDKILFYKFTLRKINLLNFVLSI